jgi:DNA-binding NtrC family response regulator
MTTLSSSYMSVAVRGSAADPAPPREILGESAVVARLRVVIALVAESQATVLVTGESGSGKELVAHDIHDRGARSADPFVAINCAAMPASLLESELFGHVRGAFTDAQRARDGLFVKARGGTLFLDEVGEMPLEMQAKLLRAVEERAVRPVGSDVTVPVDVRLITATNRNLDEEVAARRFRADLYYRLNVIEVHVPPLRERGEDILLLARAFLRRRCDDAGEAKVEISGAAARCLLDYPWPGNVRELDNYMHRAMTFSHTREIAAADLPERVQNHSCARTEVVSERPEDLLTLEEVDRRHVIRVLAAVGGNKARAARILAVNRRTIYRLAGRLGVD